MERTPPAAAAAPGRDRPALQRLLAELNHLLWRHRSFLTDLVYRLEVQQLLLVNDRGRWLPLSNEEVERGIEQVQRGDEAQRRLSAEIAAMLPLPADPTLGQICAAAPSPWDSVLGEHRAAFLALVAQAEEVSRENRELLGAGLADTRTLIDTLGGANGAAAPLSESAAYGPRAGRGLSAPRPARAGAVLVDREV